MVIRSITVRSFALVLTGAVLCALADAARAQFNLDRYTVDGGAVTAVGEAPPVDGMAPAGATPRPFRLSGAAPNPVTEQTQVAFDLPEASMVRANIYDLSGRLARVLVDQALPTGTHQRTWDRRDQSGRRVPSGLYFLRFDAEPHHDQRRIVALP